MFYLVQFLIQNVTVKTASPHPPKRIAVALTLPCRMTSSTLNIEH